MPTRILLADDHALMRHGLRRILKEQCDFEVVAEVASGIGAVEAAEALQPDVAIVDVGMKELNGIEATAQILKRSPHTAVLILSMFSDERYVIRALKAGARGYVLKDVAGEELVQAIHCVCSGKPFFSPEIAAVLQNKSAWIAEGCGVEDRYELLTERERHIYQLIAEGSSNKDIANRLKVSVHTVETHRARILEKLDLHGTADLVLSAVRRGLVT
jgi:two-component system, NarL family, response regulator NreC